MADGAAFRLVPDDARPAVSDWERAAARVLRRAGGLADDAPDDAVWAELTTDSLMGAEIGPLGLPTHLDGLPDLAVAGGRDPWPETGWDLRTWQVGPTAAEAVVGVRDDLAGGATSVWLTLAEGGLAPVDLPAVLTEVPDTVAVVLDAPADPLAAARALLGLRTGPAVHLGVDPLGAAVRRGSGAPADPADLADLAETLAATGRLVAEHGCGGPVVDATAVHEQGGTEWLELGYALAAGTAYLRLLTAAGHDVGAALGMLEFRYAATADVLVTAAKLRAARRLWWRVAEACEAPAGSGDQVQHAVSSRPMTERRDPWTNLVRGTLAAVGAAVGGADAITVLPYDAALGVPSAHGRRLARTTQEVLLAEADLARVADPAGGAYAVERMTDDLATSGWSAFQWIEREGGVAAALDSGFLAGIVGDSRGAVRTRVAHGAWPIVGATVFGVDDEVAPTRPAYPSGLAVAEPWSTW